MLNELKGGQWEGEGVEAATYHGASAKKRNSDHRKLTVPTKTIFYYQFLWLCSAARAMASSSQGIF
jgi:hypothetical protein